MSVIEVHEGDVVRLKSGGPPMTVVDVAECYYDDQVVQCRWFDGLRDVAKGFPIVALERIDAANPPSQAKPRKAPT